MTVVLPIASPSIVRSQRWFVRQSRIPRIRSMRQFAEEEVVIPDGPFEGRRYRIHRQPYAGLWFDAVDSRRWNRHVATGPTQSGKTLSCFVIPIMYHLFEVGETVICGTPSMEIAGDKWRIDLEPVIRRSRYRDWLPKFGKGSKGGVPDSLTFSNGATLKFMTGGGGDKKRAAFTGRVLVVTETDGMDESGGQSREADKITQLEGRTRAFGDQKVVYLECTVSVEEGRTWREYQGGTCSRIVLPCPHCRAFVLPEREHFGGWEEAADELEARAGASFHCPKCGKPWSEEDRRAANRGVRLIHQGQKIDRAGRVKGRAPETRTLGFRWSAVHNQFQSAADVGADEWRAVRADDEENAEKELCQFVWAVPAKPTVFDLTPLDSAKLMRRKGFPRGQVPGDVFCLTAGVDVGKFLLHWVAIAWMADGTSYVVDYGRIDVPSVDLGVEQGALSALREFRDVALEGWVKQGSGGRMIPNMVWVDSGYNPHDVVYKFCLASREGKRWRFYPSKGYGAGQNRGRSYHSPQRRPRRTSVIKHVGLGYHVAVLENSRTYLAEVDADHWKSFVHARLALDPGAAGSMNFFTATANEHMPFAKHLTAEAKVEEFVAGKGTVVRWVQHSKSNHWLDATYLASAAGHLCGVRLIAEPKGAKGEKKAAERPRAPRRGGEGRPEGHRGGGGRVYRRR